MPASYPTTVKSFTPKNNTTDVVDASHINDVQAEVTAIETDLVNATPTYITKVTTGINASALSTGTVSIARLDANVILTTSTTGINASALSMGTVPDGRLSGSYTNLTSVTIANTATAARLIENFQTYTTTISGTPTIAFNCTTGNLWNITGTISSNWTANFTNLGLANSYATAVTLVVNQGATAYLPTAVQIEGNAVTLNWPSGTQPTPNANKKDVFAFSILQTGASTYLVTGQLVSFG